LADDAGICDHKISAVDTIKESQAAQSVGARPRLFRTNLVKRQYRYGLYHVFQQPKTSAAQTQDVKSWPKIATTTEISITFHINEAPMMEQITSSICTKTHLHSPAGFPVVDDSWTGSSTNSARVGRWSIPFPVCRI